MTDPKTGWDNVEIPYDTFEEYQGTGVGLSAPFVVS